MAMSCIERYRPDLVDPAAGRVSREIFVNEEIYREGLEGLFARVWLFVGHESQIPNPGDYFVSGMGEESVILCRDRAGQVHVFLNSCRHRGMKVCRYDEGNTPVFTCPYHGWSYATDGTLVGVPYFREAYHGKLDRSQLGLVEVGPDGPPVPRMPRRVQALSRPRPGRVGRPRGRDGGARGCPEVDDSL